MLIKLAIDTEIHRRIQWDWFSKQSDNVISLVNSSLQRVYAAKETGLVL